MAAIETDVNDLIVKHLGVEREAITPEGNFVKDLGADSLDIVELVMAVEQKFSVNISDEDAETLQSRKAILDYLKSKDIN